MGFGAVLEAGNYWKGFDTRDKLIFMASADKNEDRQYTNRHMGNIDRELISSASGNNRYLRLY